MRGNIQLIEIVLGKDPVVVCFQAQILLGSSQTQKNTQATFAVLHHAQLLLDRCMTGESHHTVQLDQQLTDKSNMNTCFIKGESAKKKL